MKPEGWFYCCGILMFEDEQTAVSISARRSQQAGPYTSEEIALFQYLEPHFRCAARTQQRIKSLEKIISGELNVKALAKFDVTPAQAKLAVALFNGMSVEKYALEAGISINTARMHIQHLYGRTGVKRRTDLVRLLAKTLLAQFNPVLGDAR
jgi:DNA-binding CsgD family transcriptional regulator